MAKFRILSFDGGGIRGVLTAVLLNRLHQQIPTLLDDVHLYAGTSTGGIIALGLAAGRTPAEGVALYQKHAPDIFSRTIWRRISSLWNLIAAKYGNKRLMEILQQELGDKTLGDLAAQQRFVLIASFDLDGKLRGQQTWKPKFFHNLPGPDSDRNDKVVDVALRTSAAPTYFPSHQGYVDGGVAANNPSMAALAQALDEASANQQLGDIRLLSLGTGQQAYFLRGQTNDWGYVQWAKPLVPLLMEGSMDVANYQCQRILGEARYWRLSPMLSRAVALDDVHMIEWLVDLANSVDLAPTIDWIETNFL
jgi:patatin-like phospholipase/acyl hydrolase